MIANTLTAAVALIHAYILILEMFFWDKPQGMKSFGTTQEFATATKTMAANQGLYNGFLTAGLAWGLWLGDAGDHVKMFFLLCVAIAGLFGAATTSIRFLFVQTVPAALAMLAI